MPISSVEIICPPCPKCDQLGKKIADIVKGIETANKTKITYEFKHTANIQGLSRYGLNPSQTPAILINGKVEVGGRVDLAVLKRRLEAINKGY